MKMTTALSTWVTAMVLLTSTATSAQDQQYGAMNRTSVAPFGDPFISDVPTMEKMDAGAYQAQVIPAPDIRELPGDVGLGAQTISNSAALCGPLVSTQITSVQLVEPQWSIPIRPPGPIASFSDMRGTVLTFPPQVDTDGEATIRRMVVDSIQYVEKENGELAVSEIKGQYDDGEIVDATGLATGRVLSGPQDMIGVMLYVRTLHDRGPLLIEDIRLETRADGMLVIADQTLVDETGQVYTGVASGSCPKTLVNVCACPNFLGYCNDSNYPNCSSEQCNFGGATCEAKVEVACPGFCFDENYNPGYCMYSPGLKDCVCAGLKTPDDGWDEGPDLQVRDFDLNLDVSGTELPLEIFVTPHEQVQGNSE